MFRLFLSLLLLPLVAGAAPITVKEIDFLLRQRTPEAEILHQVRARRLPVPLDATSEALLVQHGATPTFIIQLKQGSMVLSASEAQSFALRTTPLQNAPPPGAQPALPSAEAAPAAAPAKSSAAPPPAQNQRPMLEQLGGKLVHLEGDELKNFDSHRLKDVRVYAIFCAAMWSAPSRQFTPKLVEYYKRVKAKHPDFELIFVSGDRDEFNMATYMRTQKMPWPALRYGTQAELQKAYCGDTIPWLACIGSNGEALTTNAVDKKYVSPDEIIEAIDYLLAQVK